MSLLAIDPGPEKSAWVLYDKGKILHTDIESNEYLLKILKDPVHFLGCDGADIKHVALEKVASYGMAVGESVFETVFWTGRFVQAWRGKSTRIPRKDIKMHLCQSMRAKDANIRQALIDKLGAPGTRKNPGPTFGITSHLWAALALAVTFDEIYGQLLLHGG